jgi:hypothetical protein
MINSAALAFLGSSQVASIFPQQLFAILQATLNRKENILMQRLKLGSTLRNLFVDTAIFAGFLLTTDPHATGQTVHEWLGLAFGVGVVTHLLLHWKWIVNVVRRFFSKLPGQVRINSLLDSLLFIDVTLIIFSGLMISKVVLSTFGLSGSHDAIWRWLHTSATHLALIIVALHVALHWKWIVSTIKRYVWQPLRKISVIPSRTAARNLDRAQTIPQYVRNDTAVSVRKQGGVR